jgi:ELWxxDGT repeat protein
LWRYDFYVYHFTLLVIRDLSMSAKQIVLFGASDGVGEGGLWVTDGTVDGTYQLTGISGANGNGVLSSGEPDLTIFNSELLFQGVDASGVVGLWVSNGTADGTYELTGISGAYPGGALGSAGLHPSDMTVLNGEALFDGLDANGENNLWVTDGTGQGTYEITGISGVHLVDNEPAFFAGINPDFTVFNGEVLFSGLDTNDNVGLWVTDGTAQGTHEITGISGTSVDGVGPSNMTVFNGEVLFNGSDNSLGGTYGVSGLWVTDGTAQGTHEISGISGASSAGLNPRDLTVFNGEVLFEGTDASGAYGVWVTNGTAAGTHELTNISGAYSGGIIPASTQNPDFTVFNGEVLFSGEDANGDIDLWVTDGTAQGTHEITGISGASSAGLTPQYLTVANDRVLFEGFDASGKFGLWSTDGTAQGTQEVVSGDSTHGLDPFGLTAVTICFMANTMIRTPDGEVAVETLRRGDRVMTNGGQAKPVSWIGRQTVSSVFGDPLRVLPIRIKASALDENVPSRDFLLSPDHAILIGKVLIQAGALVNGTSIIRETNVPTTFTYYHVELDDHSLILAENTPAETFVDNVDRLGFDNWIEHQALYPEGKPIVELPYPRAKAYRQVPREIRQQVDRRVTAAMGAREHVAA